MVVRRAKPKPAQICYILLMRDYIVRKLSRLGGIKLLYTVKTDLFRLNYIRTCFQQQIR
jgi:hypothetical protein